MIFNLALNYVQNIEDAEEISQDVFMKIHENLSRFSHQSTIKTWVYKITINQSLDALKARKNQKNQIFSKITRLSEPSQNQEIPEFNHPGILLENKEALEKLFRNINLLPKNQKTVVLLLKAEGLSQVEVSKIMNISTKAVESLFQRAKKNLEIILK